MPSIVIVEKNGNLKEQNLKVIVESELYKKAGFKTTEGFKCATSWAVEVENQKYNIQLWGKTTGRANQENKYEFPPPVDSLLFFGNCVLVNTENDIPANLSQDVWESIYEILYGGFEDIGEEDSDDEYDEDEDDPTIKRTKDGYIKDGFVVGDKDDEEEEEEDDEDEDDDDYESDENDDGSEEYVKKSKKPTIKIATKPKKKSAATKSTIPVGFEKIATATDDSYLDCTSELSEESYV